MPGKKAPNEIEKEILGILVRFFVYKFIWEVGRIGGKGGEIDLSSKCVFA